MKKEKRMTCFCGPSIHEKEQNGIEVFVRSACRNRRKGDYIRQLRSPAGLTLGIISPSEDPSEEIPGSPSIQD